MKTLRRGKAYASVAALGVAALVLTSCGGGPGAPETSPASTSGATATGKSEVTLYGTIADAEAKLLEESWADWSKENNITIKYESSKEFETQIAVRAQGGNAPDLAIFPQPGLLGDLATRGFLKPASEGVKANVASGWSEDWAKYGTVDGTLYGAPLMASVKGWVWYSPAEFKENGWEVPTTWQGLLDLTAQIEQDKGEAPWCAGFGSGDASGWPGTDWVEDLVLRQSGKDVYDQWVANEVKFTDPQIKSALDEVGKILKDPKYVNAGYGDITSINSTAFGDVADVMVNGDCSLTHQASFFSGFITDAGGKVGPDADVWGFVTPSMDGAGNSVTGGGEIVGAFNDDPSVVKVQEYLSSPEWANSRVKLGGVLSANKGLDPANASDPLLEEAVKILQDPATTFRFDASDLMPGSVGVGTFFRGMVDWINGSDSETVLNQIENGWPSS
ncbi:ABC transporter substrate-binding protein [Paeniglutamicibacter sulfureus]|uniref:Alpha-glucoside transport system substrate-binding protein n=1 Tax=Paeniglutamicibacter sulfureus TaxID=43666 RepID=A0ABU2BIA0_9MICC|nr:ABC transporter substrate-binding protein [Paeniglutamicibacter sulfureus]MDO2933930.1 ABC transporter substrate-binding protein [Paeniglutamicibacter sulfureus]MDR7358370.1 alpha-glucoside transport system substrate-binding protein [Paeniglutamicibacter sulfureus]